MKKNKIKYSFQTDNLFMTTKVMEQIQTWCCESSIEMEILNKKYIVTNEFTVVLVFKTEAELGLFSLRWASAIDECFQNSFIKQLQITYELIRDRHQTDRATIPGKKETC